VSKLAAAKSGLAELLARMDKSNLLRRDCQQRRVLNKIVKYEKTG
jgi:hypothetical protein